MNDNRLENYMLALNERKSIRLKIICTKNTRREVTDRKNHSQKGKPRWYTLQKRISNTKKDILCGNFALSREVLIQSCQHVE